MKAPVYVTNVRVLFELENGRVHEYAWMSHLQLNGALAKAPKWGRGEMQKAKVKGRSKIAAIAIQARRRLVRLP